MAPRRRRSERSRNRKPIEAYAVETKWPGGQTDGDADETRRSRAFGRARWNVTKDGAKVSVVSAVRGGRAQPIFFCEKRAGKVRCVMSKTKAAKKARGWTVKRLS